MKAKMVKTVGLLVKIETVALNNAVLFKNVLDEAVKLINVSMSFSEKMGNTYKINL
jgi:hypothetical protein